MSAFFTFFFFVLLKTQEVRKTCVQRAFYPLFFPLSTKVGLYILFTETSYGVKKEGIYYSQQQTKEKRKLKMKHINEYITALKTARKSERTIQVYTEHIRLFFDFIGNKAEEEVKPLDAMTWIGSYESASSATINLKINALNDYFSFLKDMEIIEKNPFEKIDRPKIVNKQKEFLSADRVKSIIGAIKNQRNKAMVTAYVTTGMRFSELANITLAEYEEALANKSNCLTIIGKGNKERKVFLNETAVKAINKYLKTRKDNDSEYLFTTVHGGKVDNANFNTSLKKFGVSAHCFRAACASIMSENGVPVAVIRDVLGHSNIQTTNRYIKTSDVSIQNAVKGMVF